mmetsp:Transcript_2986/g.5578  ORF Transcript_2986/g.5578 Transcript_2986/m.5578 type:complete len:122 (-) Transcript_2986:26-391(-)
MMPIIPFFATVAFRNHGDGIATCNLFQYLTFPPMEISPLGLLFLISRLISSFSRHEHLLFSFCDACISNHLLRATRAVKMLSSFCIFRVQIGTVAKHDPQGILYGATTHTTQKFCFQRKID